MNPNTKDQQTTLETQRDAIPVGTMIRTREAGSNTSGWVIIETKETALFMPSPKDGEAAPEAPAASAVLLESLYPHWDEESAVDAALAVRQVRMALADVERAVEAVSANEISAALNYLALAESALFKALSSSTFNRALYAAVSFEAWALRNVEQKQMMLAPLQTMVASLREIADRPFSEFNRSAEIITDLEAVGWNGESPISTAFVEGLTAQAEITLTQAN